MTTCPGCDNHFTIRGYQSHLALTRDPLCHAVFHKLGKANTAGASSDTDLEAVPFAGDAFGTAEDYMLDTFGQDINVNDVYMQEADPNNLPPLMEVSDDEDEDELEDDDKLEDDDEDVTNMVAELEKSWEPLREGAPGEEAEDSDSEGAPEVEDGQWNAGSTDLQDEEHDDDEGYAQRSTDRFIIRDGHGIKPAVRIQYNDRHPSAQASQPLSCEESRDYGYSAALGGGDNPWVPFNSKKDWEVARWAKL